jgi:hypothetical protein
MVEDQRLYAVLTGDVVKSSEASTRSRRVLLGAMQAAFDSVERLFAPLESRFTIFRGDSFQGVLADPLQGLHAALLLRASLRAGVHGARPGESLDAYIAVGIGTNFFMPKGEETLGDGDAFRRSGRMLDSMKHERRLSAPSGQERPASVAPSPQDDREYRLATALEGLKQERRLVIRTPWPAVDEELDVECALLDGIASKWSREQAEVLALRLQGHTQSVIASSLSISQPSVAARLKNAQAWAIGESLRRYRAVVGMHIGAKDYDVHI